MNRIELAVSRFAEGLQLFPTVFSAYAEGIDGATALKIAAGFGGGMGRAYSKVWCGNRSHDGGWA